MLRVTQLALLKGITKKTLSYNPYSINLIEGFPLFVLYSQRLSGLNGPLHLTRPHLEILYILILYKPP